MRVLDLDLDSPLISPDLILSDWRSPFISRLRFFFSPTYQTLLGFALRFGKRGIALWKKTRQIFVNLVDHQKPPETSQKNMGGPPESVVRGGQRD